LTVRSAAANTEFADIRLIERFFKHVDEWLAGAGEGAQVIIVNNTPPENVIDHVVVRYTRDPETPPLGVIDSETGGGRGEEGGVRSPV